ncbi:LCP family protein required for cell wall assembly [Nakamurella sp. UYEF19]|uniref:LCP family protein n=1 Tax=Nakamurella sp. UYEF19 TaxID=1756392 RepID=UPI003392657A
MTDAPDGEGIDPTAPSTAHPGRLTAGRHSRQRTGYWVVRVVAAALAVFVLLGVGLEWQIKNRAESGLQGRRVDALPPATTSQTLESTVATSLITGATPVPSTTAAAATTPSTTAVPTNQKAENILLLGSDTRSGTNAAIGVDASTAGVANSDVVMIAHISADRQHVTVLSIPRDTMIPAPTSCRQWNATTGVLSNQVYKPSPGERFHFNAGYSVGGPQCTVTEVQSLTGLHIDRYIGIDFVGFQAMVDALGGITVDICAPVVDTVLGTVVARAGVQQVTGIEALNLVRARDVVGDTSSDLARIRRQQIVLSSILRQVTAAGTLLNPGKLDGFLQAFVKNTVTDNVSIDDLVMLAGSLGNLSPGVVTFYTLPTYSSTITPGALEISEPAAANLFSALRSDLPLATDTPPPTTAATPRTSARSTATAAAPTTSATTSSRRSATSTIESVNAGTNQCAGPGNE